MLYFTPQWFIVCCSSWIGRISIPERGREKCDDDDDEMTVAVITIFHYVIRARTVDIHPSTPMQVQVDHSKLCAFCTFPYEIDRLACAIVWKSHYIDALHWKRETEKNRWGNWLHWKLVVLMIDTETITLREFHSRLVCTGETLLPEKKQQHRNDDVVAIDCTDWEWEKHAAMEICIYREMRI